MNLPTDCGESGDHLGSDQARGTGHQEFLHDTKCDSSVCCGRRSGGSSGRENFRLKWNELLRSKPLLEELELLVDGLLGGLHLDEAVDEALAVGLDPLFEVGDLDVNFARLLG